MPPEDQHAGSEFPQSLDVEQLLLSGWRPLAFRQFILKIHSRCDLACTHCYVYEMADQGWRSQPTCMSDDVIEKTATRIAEHVSRHGLSEIDIILHGGEPLLAGPFVISRAVRAVREAVGDGTRVTVYLQTNGLRLDDDFLRLFAELDVRLGISFDGYAEAHDRYRVFRNGRGSHAEVTRSLQL